MCENITNITTCLRLCYCAKSRPALIHVLHASFYLKVTAVMLWGLLLNIQFGSGRHNIWGFITLFRTKRVLYRRQQGSLFCRRHQVHTGGHYVELQRTLCERAEHSVLLDSVRSIWSAITQLISIEVDIKCRLFWPWCKIVICTLNFDHSAC
jgi:hypothetical protein